MNSLSISNKKCAQRFDITAKDFHSLKINKLCFTDVLEVKFHSMLSLYIIRRRKKTIELKVYSLDVFFFFHIFPMIIPFYSEIHPLLQT